MISAIASKNNAKPLGSFFPLLFHNLVCNLTLLHYCVSSEWFNQ